jgi:hypothetical protein
MNVKTNLGVAQRMYEKQYTSKIITILVIQYYSVRNKDMEYIIEKNNILLRQ